MVQLKKCSVCRKEKPYADFTRNPGNRNKTGLRCSCRLCSREIARKRIKREYSPDLTIQNKECSCCEITKPISDFNKNKRTSTGYNSACKTCQSTKNSKRYEKDSERIKLLTGTYYHENKDIIRLKKRAYNKRRLQEDLFYKLQKNLRNRLWYALENEGWKKNTHFAEYIGCTYEELINHLENQFTEGMSWENYGGNPKTGWDIDHYMPLSSAKTPDELYKLCHYKNLRPSWALYNRNEKRDKIPEELVNS